MVKTDLITQKFFQFLEIAFRLVQFPFRASWIALFEVRFGLIHLVIYALLGADNVGSQTYALLCLGALQIFKRCRHSAKACRHFHHPFIQL